MSVAFGLWHIPCAIYRLDVKVFITKFNSEIAECELIGNGLPVTQEGAEKLAKLQWEAMRKHRKRGKAYGSNFQSQVC